MLQLSHLYADYGGKPALEDINLTLDSGELLVVLGPSGCGKTTLLNCVSTIDSVTSGHIIVGGRDITGMSRRQLAKFRRDDLGFIFQDSNLLDTLTGFENISLALTIKGAPARTIPGKVNAMAARGAAAGVNIVDCWMSDPVVRSALGEALEPTRDQWIIQGHIGSTWQDGQYVRTRELDQVRPAFEDLLERLRTDHVELGMIHYVDACDEFRAIMDGPFIEYVRELLAAGKIGHIGLSTHNPEVALLACDEPEIEVIMFSLNPAFDMMPASEDLEDLFGDYENVAGDGIDKAFADGGVDLLHARKAVHLSHLWDALRFRALQENRFRL